MNDFSPTVRRREMLDQRNTFGGGSNRPMLSLPPAILARLALEVARIEAEAKKIEQAQLRKQAQPWQPHPLIVASKQARKAWWWEGFLVAGMAIFVAEACVKLLTGHWMGR